MGGGRDDSIGRLQLIHRHDRQFAHVGFHPDAAQIGAIEHPDIGSDEQTG
jgi:hypothetical protein